MHAVYRAVRRDVERDAGVAGSAASPHRPESPHRGSPTGVMGSTPGSRTTVGIASFPAKLHLDAATEACPRGPTFLISQRRCPVSSSADARRPAAPLRNNNE